MSEILYKDESFQIMGACFDVYKYLGSGFLEAVYQESLGIEFLARQIPFVPQADLCIRYKGHTLQATYKPDFICFDKIIIELKAVSELCDQHRAQVLNYLKATNYRLGLLLNFHAHPKLQYERIVL